MALEATSSSFPPQTLQKEYDVFISFRGEDTRSSFTSHLYKALCDKQITTFKDDQELPKGDDISPSLLHAIEDSYISVVLLSENYATSRWCLDELVHILHCKRVQAQVVLPVFYKVDPSDVRKQTGVYKQAFERYEKVDQYKVQQWKQAHNEAANLSGYDSHKFRDEAEMIQTIVNDILQMLNHKYPPAELKGLIGIDENCARIESLLRGAKTIGIWGMGGIGKSTIAKTIFYKYSSHYESSCFLENVREKSQFGLDELRRQFLSHLLKEDLSVGAPTKFLESRLSRMKVFVVLDDISTLSELEYLIGCYQKKEYLIGESHCFGQESKILITTRDKHVLISKGVDEVYKVKELELHHSYKLFSLNAFNTDRPITGHNELMERVIVYSKGIPLALKVLGSYLRGRSEDEWKSALRKLEKCPFEDIQKVLRLSYDGLNHEERNIFLDIACFLKGEPIESVITLLESFGFHGAIGLSILHDKALINVSDGLKVKMHDLIQEMGLQIVREESLNDPGRRSRLCDDQEIHDVLTNNTGTRKIQGMKLNVYRIKDLHLKADIFKKNVNMRYLKFYSDAFVDHPSHVHLPQGLKFFPNKLRYLEWYGFPHKSIPSTFSPEKLVKLSMQNSDLQKLWDGVQDFVSLQEIDLCGSKQLRVLPNLSKCLHLEVVKLRDCKSLLEVHPSILSLDSLFELDLYGCENLKSLKSDFHLKSLQHIDVVCCRNLKEFSVSSVELRELDLISTGTEIIHKSICRSRKLEILRLGARFRYLEPHSESFYLRSLWLYHCQMIDDRMLHVFFGGMLSLREVHLHSCYTITELPNNTKYLSLLKSLTVATCRSLRCLPELPPSIEKLHAYDCESLEIVPTWRPSSGGVRNFSFLNCVKLNEQSLNNIMEAAYSTVYYVSNENVNHTYPCMIEVPGSKVPQWFKYRAAESSIIVELPHISDLTDVFLCLVISFHSQYMPGDITLECTCYLEGYVLARSQEQRLVGTKSDHVLIWNAASGVMHEIRRGHQQLLANMELRFEFAVETEGSSEVRIKECGVHPLCVSECQKSVQQMEVVDGPSDVTLISSNTMADDAHMPLLYLEITVRIVRLVFPSEVIKLAMDIAHAQTTSESAGLSASKASTWTLREVDLNKNLLAQDKRLAMIDILRRTVENCRRYFPHCMEVLDVFMEEDDWQLLGSRSQRIRFMELKDDIWKALDKDEVAGIPLSSSLPSLRGSIDYKDLQG